MKFFLSLLSLCLELSCWEKEEMEECLCVSIVVSLERSGKEQLNRNIYGLILHNSAQFARPCLPAHWVQFYTLFNVCDFFCFECTFGDFTGCLPVCGQLLPVCCLSFLRIFVAKDKILACKMFEIKSDRWHGILFCCRDFSNSFLFIIQLHKSFILWELFVFLQNLIIFHPNFSFIGSDFYL